MGELPTLDEFPMDELHEESPVGLTQFQLQETETLTQTQAPGNDPVTEMTRNVFSHLKAMHTAAQQGPGGPAEHLLLSACTLGMSRSDAAKLFYQLLGATFSGFS